MAKKTPGLWVRLSHGFYNDPKLKGLPAGTQLMFVKALAYCGQHRLDGFIPRPALADLSNRPATDAKRLCEAKLWAECEDERDGYVIVSWGRWQDSDAEQEARRADVRGRVRKHRATPKKDHGNQGVTEVDTELIPSSYGVDTELTLSLNAVDTQNQSQDDRDDLPDYTVPEQDAPVPELLTTPDVTRYSNKCNATDRDRDKDNYNSNYSLTTADAVAVTDPSTRLAADPTTAVALIEEKPKPALKQKTSTPGFDEFWDLYPKKVDKQKALKAFTRISKEKTFSFEAILFGLRNQLPDFAARDPKYVPHPTSWLNGARWEDEPQTPRTTSNDQSSSALMRNKLMKQYQQMRSAENPPDNVIPIWGTEMKEIAS